MRAMGMIAGEQYGAAAAALACAVLAGCASVGARPGPFAVPGGAETTETTRCVRWFAALDAATDRAHVRDGGAVRVPGFPFLRVDRFLSSFRVEGSASATTFSAWGTRLRALDAGAREAELANLPDATLLDLAVPDKAAAQATTRRCADQLWREVESNPAQRAALIERAQVPDDYTAWKRAVGLYPLTRLPFFAGVQGWQNRLNETFAQTAAQPAPATLRRFGMQPPGLAADAVALVRAAPRDALGVPQFTTAKAQRLLAAHAPVWEIDSHGAFDAFGALYWPAERAPRTPPAVSTAQPVVYARLAFTRVGAEVWPQLVYSLWFPERPLGGGVDLLGGPLDAVVLRLTLAPDGAPRMVDTIHACGCYHLFVPVGAAQLRPPPGSLGSSRAAEEWAFVPAQLPAIAPGQRIAVRLQSATHYVVGLRVFDDAPGGTAALDGHYRLADDDALRQLPLPEGGTRSAFGADGIIVGTERGERLLFWPMGIDSPGAMRQWGRQPTAFVGRRHFDDARLVGERFEFR